MWSTFCSSAYTFSRLFPICYVREYWFPVKFGLSDSDLCISVCCVRLCARANPLCIESTHGPICSTSHIGVSKNSFHIFSNWSLIRQNDELWRYLLGLHGTNASKDLDVSASLTKCFSYKKNDCQWFECQEKCGECVLQLQHGGDVDSSII